MTVTESEKDWLCREESDTDKQPQVTMGDIYGLRLSVNSTKTFTISGPGEADGFIVSVNPYSST